MAITAAVAVIAGLVAAKVGNSRGDAAVMVGTGDVGIGPVLETRLAENNPGAPFDRSSSHVVSAVEAHLQYSPSFHSHCSTPLEVVLGLSLH